MFGDVLGVPAVPNKFHPAHYLTTKFRSIKPQRTHRVSDDAFSALVRKRRRGGGLTRDYPRQSA